MKRALLPIAAVALLMGSLWIFRELVLALARRDYVGAILLLFAGTFLARYGTDAARWALYARR